jgi:hypothetical protein
MSDEDRIKTLEDEILNLRDQLSFARQKASLYYITASELDSLKRTMDGSNSLKVDAFTWMENIHLSSLDSVSTQTDLSSAEMETRIEIEMIKTENELLKTFNEDMKRTEKVRIRFQKNLEKLNCDSSKLDWLVDEYSSLFEEYLRSSQISVNHSVEIKRRDDMISSLFEKIRVLESSFTQKILRTEAVANARQTVINELSEQVKEAMRIDRATREWVDSHLNEDGSAISWTEIAAMHSELEDLRAELSMARTNWTATRDELLRLQFRVGIDGSGKSEVERNIEFPPPILSSPVRSSGVISGIRNIRTNN